MGAYDKSVPLMERLASHIKVSWWKAKIRYQNWRGKRIRRKLGITNPKSIYD